MKTKEFIRNYAISVNDTDMYITILRSGKTYYTNYDKGFLELMKSGIFTGATTNKPKHEGYLKFTYYIDGKQIGVYFHHIVFCYYYRSLTKENYAETLKNFSIELAEKKANIDHLQNGVYNNRKWNLSLVPQTINTTKKYVEKSFRDIFNIQAAFDGNGYRVQFAYLNKDIRTLQYYCDTPNELNNLYRYLKKHKWELRKAKVGKILSNNFYSISGTFENYYSKHFSTLAITEEAHDIQKHLTEMPKDEFCKYKE